MIAARTAREILTASAAAESALAVAIARTQQAQSPVSPADLLKMAIRELNR